MAVDLSVNPNTVVRAYRQLETEGMLETQQGSGTFVGRERPRIDELERKRQLDQLVTDLLARGSSYGFSLEEVLEVLSFKQLGFHAKPVVIVNVRGYYDPLLAQIERGFQEGFIQPAFRDMFAVATDADTAVAHIERALTQQSR